jgi:hypothetical protein
MTVRMEHDARDTVRVTREQAQFAACQIDYSDAVVRAPDPRVRAAAAKRQLPAIGAESNPRQSGGTT